MCCRLDDLIIGAPLFMERTHDGRIQEVGRVYIYLQDYNMSTAPSMVLTGQHEYGRFGSSIAILGDLDQDGFNGNQRNILFKGWCFLCFSCFFDSFFSHLSHLLVVIPPFS